MRFIVHLIMFGIARGMALPLPCDDHPEIWQDDGYGGRIWTVNPDCYKQSVTTTTPTPAEGFPSSSDSNDTMTEYDAYDEEYVDDAEQDKDEVPPVYDELGTFNAGIIDVKGINHLQVSIDGFKQILVLRL